ncbi:MAG: 3-keto-5-aminohexanoate cleavage protein [Desulfobacteraceae bacterium]|nr:MAG: 3-keto-5-aminohexanoate cleavage protein [Desulfobacteraceae bacterium]
MRKVVITVALTGGFQGKDANPSLPEQPDEICESACACYKEGASIAHIHARDRDGKPTGNTEIFRQIKEKISSRCNIVIAFSTGGNPGASKEERIQPILADPEMSSLNMGSLVRPSGYVWLNNSDLLEEWASKFRARGIKPELEVYSHSMLEDVKNLINKGLIDKPYFINIVLGMKRQGALPADPKILLSLIDFLPPDSVFNVTAIGAMQLPITTLGLLMGGNIRVGLEDNLYYTKGVLATNEQLVARSVRIVRELGFKVATPDEAREILGLRRMH